jgi:hypothetical protein
VIKKRGNSWWVVVYAGRDPSPVAASHGRHLGETGARPTAPKPVAWRPVAAGTEDRRYGSRPARAIGDQPGGSSHAVQLHGRF